MNMLKAFWTIAILLMLGACTVSGPSVSVRPPIAVKVDGGGGGGHCPPGQAKKGNC